MSQSTTKPLSIMSQKMFRVGILPIQALMGGEGSVEKTFRVTTPAIPKRAFGTMPGVTNKSPTGWPPSEDARTPGVQRWEVAGDLGKWWEVADRQGFEPWVPFWGTHL